MGEMAIIKQHKTAWDKADDKKSESKNICTLKSGNSPGTNRGVFTGREDISGYA
jgi:hypothetical protein